MARILVIDDEPAVSELLNRVLLQMGLAVDLAATGEAGLSMFRPGKYDVVITDFVLPGIDGVEVLRQLMKQDPAVDVIVMTGYATIDMAVDSTRLGAYDIIQKPFRIEAITARVNSALRLKSATRRDVAIERLIDVEWEELESEALTPGRRGSLLESFMRLLLSSIPGFVAASSNYRSRSEEIDVCFRNESTDPFWLKYKPLILVECKNWTAKLPGRSELDAFASKIRRRRAVCDLGFFVSYGGFPRTVQEEAPRLASESILVPCLDRGDLEALLGATDRNGLLKQIVLRSLGD